MDWNKLYLTKLLEFLNPTGHVLQVGFHSNECVRQIQNFQPKTHTLIENDPKAIEAAKKWTPAVKIIENSWENALTELGVFDTLFFHNSIESAKKGAEKKNETSSKTSDSSPQKKGINVLAFSQAKQTLNMVENMFPELRSIQYSDADIEAFFQTFDPSSEHQFFFFLKELKDNGQISKEQWKRAIRKHMQPVEDPIDPLVQFLQTCLEKHMRQGSTASWVSETLESKYDCPVFFEHIVTHPNVEYQEQTIPLEGKGALVMIVQKFEKT